MNKLPLLLNQDLGKRDFSSIKKDIDFKNNALRIYGDKISFQQMEKRVLIITSMDDTEVNVLGPKLIQNDIDYIRINAEDFRNYFDFSFSIYNGLNQKEKNNIKVKSHSYDLDSIDYIWVRHFSSENFFFNDHLDYICRKYLVSEWTEVFDSIYSLYQEKLITPTNNRITKPKQLIYAKEVGLDIPNTIITNSRESLLDFFKNYNGKIFAKALRHHSFYNTDGTVIDFYGRTFEHVEMILLENIESAPVIYQEQIDKSNSTEYRINIFNGKISSFIYENVDSDDWHFEDITGLKMVKKDIPSTVKEKLFKLFKNLNLKVGTVDIINQEHRWYFLEINIGGDWKWLESASGEDITKDAIDLFKH